MTHNFRPTQPLFDRIIYFNSGDEIPDNNYNYLNLRPLKDEKMKSKGIKIMRSLIVLGLAIVNMLLHYF